MKESRAYSKKQTSLNPIPLAPERSQTLESFRALSGKEVHFHDHFKTAHVHKPGVCDRFASGLDKNRERRFYFTGKKTSVRVYLNYDESLVVSDPLDELPQVKPAGGGGVARIKGSVMGGVARVKGSAMPAKIHQIEEKPKEINNNKDDKYLKELGGINVASLNGIYYHYHSSGTKQDFS